MSPLFRSLAAWTLVLLVLAMRCRAATVLADGYSLRVWQTEDGLPENLVTSAAQTKDGYLWFGTLSGLARFDGERFHVFNPTNTPELPDRRVVRLFADSQGTLWIGQEAGHVSRYREGRFERVMPPRSPENERIIGLGSDEQGAMWAMRENGAVDSLEGDVRLPSLIGAERPGLMGWSRGPDGSLWLWENWQAARLTNSRLVRLKFPSPQDTPYVSGLAGSADGGVWLLSDNRIRKWKDLRWTEDRGASPWPAATISCTLELRDGTLAVGTVGEGLYLIFPDGRPAVHFSQRNGLPQNWIRCIFEDREGTLWAGSGNSGLVSIRSSPFAILAPLDRWNGSSVLSVAAGHEGALWVGTDGAGLYRYAAGGWSRYGEAEGLGNQYICSVVETPAREVWAGNFWWGGPYLLEEGRFVRPPGVDAAWSPAFALLPIPETGELLVGNRDGLLRLNRDHATWLIRSPQGSADDVCAVARDRDGTIWCGFAQGGLARLAGGEVTIYDRRDLRSNSVQCLLADNDGALWIGTADGGLIRFKNGKFVPLGQPQGLADTIVCSILDDGLGYFWLSTHHGIQRVEKAELNRCADGTIGTFASQTFDRSDGLPIVEFRGARQASACTTDDGRLWFVSSTSLIAVDPARIRPNPIPPPVIVESLVADGRTVPVLNGEVAAPLPPDHERLEFRFSGLSYASPNKVLFKYRLEGFDKTWVEAGPRRTASYSRLPAGTYRLRVIACNNDGIWNPAGASLAFTIAPFFWETWWFVGSCVLATLIGVAWFSRYLTRRRMQRQIEQMEREHEIERERARIAQDIHDDVGASLSRIAMLSQPARRDLAEPERTAAMLSRIYATAREVTRSLDEIVWAVDPRHDTLDSLVDYMGRYAQDFLAAANVRCRLDLPVKVPAWPLTAEIRHNLFLAFKEALNNAVKHAAATEARISFALRPDSFELIVKDNGHGFDPTLAKSAASGRIGGGHGLTNMKKRLTRIGGRCEITSDKNAGTSVALIVTFSNPAPDEPSPISSNPPSPI